jgi:hypothetical protein
MLLKQVVKEISEPGANRLTPALCKKENFDKKRKLGNDILIEARTPPVRCPPWEQEDSQRRNYTVLHLCPRPVVAVTTVTVPVLTQRRLVILRLNSCFQFWRHQIEH